MRPIRDVRRENLARLVQECTPQTQAELARRINKDKNQVLQWLMEPDAKGARNIGNASARHVERVMGKPEGWMDADQETFSLASSQFLSPDPETLHTALIQLNAETAVGVKYPGIDWARRLVELYVLVRKEGGRLSTATNARLMEEAIERGRPNRRERNARDDGDRDGVDERGAAASER
jgi:hypothetical protein